MFNLFQIDNTEVDHNEDGYTDGLAQDANDEEQVMMIENPQARYYMECSLYKTQPPPTAVVVPCRYSNISMNIHNLNTSQSTRIEINYLASSQGVGPFERANGRYVDDANGLGMVLGDEHVVIASNQASTLAMDIKNQHPSDFASPNKERLPLHNYEATSICDTAAAEVGALASHAKNTGHLTALELKPRMFKERPDAAVDLNGDLYAKANYTIMSFITAQQAKLDLELVPNEKRLEIRKCNGRLNPRNTQREPTFQVVLDALALTPCYSAFLTTADVPEVYMHQFWDSIHKHDTSYRFIMDRKKKFYLNLETFRDIFQICPRVHGQDFDELPSDEFIVSFFKELGHTREIKSITNVVVNQMHQPGELLLLSSTKVCLEIHPVLTSFVFLEHKSFRECTIRRMWTMLNYFGKISLTRLTTETVSKRNKIGMHTSRGDYLINTLRFVFANEVSQIYGARLPESMTSPEMRETKAYKTYLGYATGVTPPKKARKFKKPISPKLTTVPTSPNEPTKKSKRVKRPESTNAPTVGVVIRDTPGVSVSKKKAPAKADRGKGIELLSDAALFKDAQLKKALKKSRQETHKLQASGSSEGADFESEVPDESKSKSSDTRDSEDDNESDDNNDEGSENDDDSGNDAQDSERTNSDEEENPNLNMNVDEEEETQEEDYVHSLDYSVPTDEEKDDGNKEFDDEEYGDLYKDVNVRSKVTKHEEVGKGDVEMTDATRESGSQEKSYEQVIEDAHVTLTTSQNTEGSKQSSSVSSDFASKFLILDHVPPVVDEVASLLNVKVHQEDSSTQAPLLLSVPVTAILETFTVPATIVPLTITMITPLPQPTTPFPAPTTASSTTSIPALPNFSSLFGFDQRVSTLEKELSPFKQADYSA
ncbi:hypothetical protein Tco_1168684 [Tanacetum coccineum]